ncbi:MAG: peptide chain release factor N(5)-glutamine methyltransferase [Trueperella sp.]|nr:peptide chain release factor N(5)-glutamine methyltransferase [Trueperella sp.]
MSALAGMPPDSRPRSTWQAVMRQVAEQLAAAGIDSSAAEARLLVADAAGVEQPWLSPVPPTPAQLARLSHTTAARLERQPIQHVLGKMWFRYLELAAGPGVFSVRPETEAMVDAALAALPQLGEHPRVVDLCSGSGAIAIAIATEYPRAAVSAAEISPAAYGYAQRNNASYGNSVDLVLGDARTAFPQLLGTVDLVISNPPYVPPTDELPPEVRHDPQLALFGGGSDGLDLPAQLISRAAQLLRPGGVLFMEHAPEQAAKIVAIAARDFEKCETGRDLTGRERWLRADKAN